MAEVKKNKDGLVGGKLVSPSDHNRVMREKMKAKARKIATGK